MPPAEEMEALGYTAEDYDDEIELWPENERSILFFASLGMGAWNHGMSGPCGLRYESLPFQFEMSGIKRKHWKSVYADLLVMESAALKAMHSK